MKASELLARLERVRRVGRGWSARCPAHDDRNPSLSISEERGNILLYCHAGCSTQSVCAAIGIEVRDLFASNGSDTPSASKIAAIYDYRDERGELLYQVVRYVPKAFKQRRPDGRGGWIWNLNGVPRVPYRLPDVLDAPEGVIVCEGERDCDTAWNMGLIATCNPGGAGKWDPKFAEFMRGKPVAVIADADALGLVHAHDVARSLIGVATQVRLIKALPQAKDLTEYHEKGGTPEKLLQIFDETPVLTAADVAKPDPPPAAPVPRCAMSGEEILGHLVGIVRRYVALFAAQADVIALWIIHSHAVDAAQSTPYLAITSAEKQCGKTRLLEVLELLVANPWMTGGASAAVLFRTIEEMRPTLLLDESDAALNGDPEYAEGLRGVLNSGHRKGGKCSRCERAGATFIRRFRDVLPEGHSRHREVARHGS